MVGIILLFLCLPTSLTTNPETCLAISNLPQSWQPLFESSLDNILLEYLRQIYKWWQIVWIGYQLHIWTLETADSERGVVSDVQLRVQNKVSKGTAERLHRQRLRSSRKSTIGLGNRFDGYLVSCLLSDRIVSSGDRWNRRLFNPRVPEVLNLRWLEVLLKPHCISSRFVTIPMGHTGTLSYKSDSKDTYVRTKRMPASSEIGHLDGLGDFLSLFEPHSTIQSYISSSIECLKSFLEVSILRSTSTQNCYLSQLHSQSMLVVRLGTWSRYFLRKFDRKVRGKSLALRRIQKSFS